MSWFEYLSIGLIILLGAMSPGPDFIIVTKNSLQGSRYLGILTSVGVCAALTIHVLYSSLGLAFLLHESKVAYFVVKIAGAVYLCYLGIQMIRQRNTVVSHENSTPSVQLTPGRAFTAGFLTNLLNPKASLFIMGLFTQIVQPGTSSGAITIIGLEIVLIHIVWFSLLSTILTHEKIYVHFNKFQSHLNLGMGVLLIGFAFKLAVS